MMLYNTDIPTLNKAHDVLERMGLAHYVQHTSKSTGYRTAKGQKRVLWQIRIVGFKRCLPALIALTPYLTTRRPQAELLLHWVRGRLAMPINGKLRPPYTDDELALVKRLRAINRGLGSETTRWVPI